MPGFIITMIWVAHHWFPVAIKLHAGRVQVTTTPGADWLLIATRGLGDHIGVNTVQIHRVFNNDCGFQALAWIMSATFDVEFATPGHRMRPFMPKDAITWRCLFEQDIHAQAMNHSLVIPSQLKFGGVGSQDITAQVAQLLKDWGVDDKNATDRATTVIDKIG